MKFTQIPDRITYPPRIKGQLSTLHSQIIDHVISHYVREYYFHRKVIDVMNTVSMIVSIGDSLPSGWEPSHLEKGLVLADAIQAKSSLGSLYINLKEVEWDINESADSATTVNTSTRPPLLNQSKTVVRNQVNSRASDSNKKEGMFKHSTRQNSDALTPKEDLYIQGPTVPIFNSSSPMFQVEVDGNILAMYSSLPEVPQKQNQISCTTDVTRMTRAELLRLFPNHFIQTRAPKMYEPIQGLEFDQDLGVILNIDGFTSAQVRDNIIRYPHIFRLKKNSPEGEITFYSTLEIDHELKSITEMWSRLDDTKSVPYSTEYAKEYVVRRYLLERDINHIHHRYSMCGTLDPFLTLFSTTDDYVRFGYTDLEGIARKCVEARVSYKRSRNPILRRAEYA